MVLWKNILIINQPRLHLPFHHINYTPLSPFPSPLPFPGHFTSCTKLAPETPNCLHMLGLLPPPTTDNNWSDLLPSQESKPLQMGFIFWAAGGPVEDYTTPPAVLSDLPWRLDTPVWISGHLDSHPYQSLSRWTDLANWSGIQHVAYTQISMDIKPHSINVMIYDCPDMDKKTFNTWAMNHPHRRGWGRGFGGIPCLEICMTTFFRFPPSIIFRKLKNYLNDNVFMLDLYLHCSNKCPMYMTCSIKSTHALWTVSVDQMLSVVQKYYPTLHFCVTRPPPLQHQRKIQLY